MSLDPVETNPDHYKVVFENDRVRVLEYTDRPGDDAARAPGQRQAHAQLAPPAADPGDQQRDVEMPAGMTGWLPAQQHAGENIGDTETHVLFVELEQGVAGAPDRVRLGPG